MGACRHVAYVLATASGSCPYHPGAHRSNLRQRPHVRRLTCGLSSSSALALRPVCQAGSAEKLMSQEPHSTSDSQGLVDTYPSSLTTLGGITEAFDPGCQSFPSGMKLHLSNLGHGR